MGGNGSCPHSPISIVSILRTITVADWRLLYSVIPCKTRPMLQANSDPIPRYCLSESVLNGLRMLRPNLKGHVDSLKYSSVPATSRMVIRIQPHVFRGKVSRPEPGARLAFFKDEHDTRVAIGSNRFSNRITVEVHRCAPFV
jgi:hypothetical protein